MSDTDGYPYPVSELLSHGPVKGSELEDWFDYVGHYGLSEIDVPSLISLAFAADINLADPDQSFAPVHACRALGQLGDAAADSYLVKLLDNDDNDWVTESVLISLSMLGPRSLDVLQQYFDRPETGMWNQILAAQGFAVFAQRNPSYRAQCVSWLSQTLANYAQQPPDLNGFLIYYLVELRATEASQIIEQAFRSGHVDEDVNGPWSEVQAELASAGESDCIETATTSRPRRLSDVNLAGSYSITGLIK